MDLYEKNNCDITIRALTYSKTGKPKKGKLLAYIKNANFVFADDLLTISNNETYRIDIKPYAIIKALYSIIVIVKI